MGLLDWFPIASDLIITQLHPSASLVSLATDQIIGQSLQMDRGLKAETQLVR